MQNLGVFLHIFFDDKAPLLQGGTLRETPDSWVFLLAAVASFYSGDKALQEGHTDKLTHVGLVGAVRLKFVAGEFRRGSGTADENAGG
jgi:hypothetical protein